MGLLLLLGAISAQASEVETGKVKLLILTGGVRVSSAVPPQAGTGTARCTGGIFGGMDLSLSSDFGKAIFSKLLAAEASGQSVVFWYTYTASGATCTLDGVATP
jgi:hypothetical protein